MLENTLHKIEDLLRSSPQLSESKRQELLSLINELKQELAGLNQLEREKALEVVSASHAKAEGFEKAVEEFELSHPRLYEIIKDLVISLRGLGV
jgi:ribonuclease HII